MIRARVRARVRARARVRVRAGQVRFWAWVRMRPVPAVYGKHNAHYPSPVLIAYKHNLFHWHRCKQSIIPAQVKLHVLTSTLQPS